MTNEAVEKCKWLKNEQLEKEVHKHNQVQPAILFSCGRGKEEARLGKEEQCCFKEELMAPVQEKTKK